MVGVGLASWNAGKLNKLDDQVKFMECNLDYALNYGGLEEVFIDGDYMIDGVAQRRRVKPKKLRLSEKLNNDFKIETDYNNQPVTIKFKDYIKGAVEGLTPSENGEEYIKIVESGDGERHDRLAADGVDVGQRVSGGDPAEIVSIIDDGHEEIGGRDYALFIVDFVYGCIVTRFEAHQHCRIRGVRRQLR